MKVGDVLALEKEGGVWVVRRQPGDLVEFMRELGTPILSGTTLFVGRLGRESGSSAYPLAVIAMESLPDTSYSG